MSEHRQMNYDEKVVWDTFKKFKTEFLKRLPIHTLPSTLEAEGIISSAEYSLITNSNISSQQQREKLVDMMWTKDGNTILRLLWILEYNECGYPDLVAKFFATMNGMSTKPTLQSPTCSSSGLGIGAGWLSGYSSPPPLSPKEPDTQVIPNGAAHGSMTVFLDSMPAKLQVLSSVLLDKTVYISGVTAHSVPKSDQIHAYSFCTDKWTTLPKGPNYNAHTAVINGHITQIGGRDSDTNAITNVVSTWVEEERRWNQDLLPMPTKRLECGVCLHDNLLLVTGGVMESPEDREKGIVVSTVHVYNISTGRWSSPKALELPKPLRSHHLVVAEEHIYLLSGGTSYPVQDSEKRFNPHAWTAAWSDVIEAIDQDASTAPEPSEPAKSMWTPINAPPVLRPTVIPYQNSLISVGGVKGGSPQNTIYEFVKVDGTWSEVGNMRLGRYRHGVVTLGKQDTALFVAGGYVQGKPMEDEVDEKCSFTEIVLL